MLRLAPINTKADTLFHLHGLILRDIRPNSIILTCEDGERIENLTLSLESPNREEMLIKFSALMLHMCKTTHGYEIQLPEIIRYYHYYLVIKIENPRQRKFSCQVNLQPGASTIRNFVIVNLNCGTYYSFETEAVPKTVQLFSHQDGHFFEHTVPSTHEKCANLKIWSLLTRHLEPSICSPSEENLDLLPRSNRFLLLIDEAPSSANFSICLTFETPQYRNIKVNVERTAVVDVVTSGSYIFIRSMPKNPLSINYTSITPFHMLLTHVASEMNLSYPELHTKCEAPGSFLIMKPDDFLRFLFNKS
jgi:hypothetical protein